MCFGGSSKTPKPEPTYPTRFEYNRPTGTDTQRQQVAAANTGTQPAFGSDLGSTAPKPQTTGGY
jgi:hypothetical protein